MSVIFGNMPGRSGTWSWFRALASSKHLSLQFEEAEDKYFIYGYDSPEVLSCQIWKGNVPDPVISGGYSQSQNDTDKTDFETNYKPNGNKSVLQKTSDGLLRSTSEKTDISKKTIISHDWTDRTTWSEGAARVVDEIASDSGNHLTYNLDNDYIIDTYHAKITNEDFLKDASNNSYRVVVKVNDVTKTEQDPHTASGGDYTINYNAGSITFLSALEPSDEVKVTYHYAVSSVFTVKPSAGKLLKIEFAEVQMSEDIEILDSVIFQPYGFVEVFAPQYCTINGGPYPPGTKIPLGNPVVYKSITDYQNEAVKSYPTYPAMGGSGWRGTTHDIVIFDWDYVSSTVLRSDYGMEVRLSLQHDTPFNGWYATATFYCLNETI